MDAINPVAGNVEAKKKILLVDDDTLQLTQTKENLRDIYDVIAVRSGAAALKFLSRNLVDIILLDYMMPEMDGPTVYSHIKEIPEALNIPIVFLTGAAEKETFLNTINELKPQGIITKPAKRSDIVDKITEILG